MMDSKTARDILRKDLCRGTCPAKILMAIDVILAEKPTEDSGPFGKAPTPTVDMLKCGDLLRDARKAPAPTPTPAPEFQLKLTLEGAISELRQAYHYLQLGNDVVPLNQKALGRLLEFFDKELPLLQDAAKPIVGESGMPIVAGSEQVILQWTTSTGDIRSGCRSADQLGKLVDETSYSPQHPDDLAIDRFAQAMKDRMAAKRRQGRSGWETCQHPNLSQFLRRSVDRGDPIDVANYAMMHFHKGWVIPAPVLAKDDPNPQTPAAKAFEVLRDPATHWAAPIELTPEMLWKMHHSLDWEREGQDTSAPSHRSQRGKLSVGTTCEEDIRDAWKAAREEYLGLPIDPWTTPEPWKYLPKCVVAVTKDGIGRIQGHVKVPEQMFHLWGNMDVKAYSIHEFFSHANPSPSFPPIPGDWKLSLRKRVS